MRKSVVGDQSTLHVGTSGFSYDAWKGSFYPPDIKAKDMLPCYATRFTSVEINYTARRLPSAKTLETWRAATPDGFTFALKAHQRITHTLRLANAADALSKFFAAIAPLGPRTGPILFQCPPKFRFDEARLVSFLALLPRGPRCAFEFRDPSWAAARPLLESQAMGWCVAEADDEDAPDDALATGSFHYLRLRRTDYTDRQLGRWAERIGDARRRGCDVYCYFKHEDVGKGPMFARRLARLLGET